MGSLARQEQARDRAHVRAAAPDQPLLRGEAVPLDLAHLGPEGDRQGTRHDAPGRRLGHVRVRAKPARAMSQWRSTTPARNGQVTRPDSTDLSVFRAGLLSELLSSSQEHFATTQLVVCEARENHTM